MDNSEGRNYNVDRINDFILIMLYGRGLICLIWKSDEIDGHPSVYANGVDERRRPTVLRLIRVRYRGNGLIGEGKISLWIEETYEAVKDEEFGEMSVREGL